MPIQSYRLGFLVWVVIQMFRYSLCDQCAKSFHSEYTVHLPYSKVREETPPICIYFSELLLQSCLELLNIFCSNR